VRGWRIRIGIFLAVALGYAAFAGATAWTDRHTGLTRTPTGWTGTWYVARAGLIDVGLDSSGPVAWRIDGYRAVGHSASETSSRRTIMLARGFHHVDVDIDEHAASGVRLSWAPPGSPLRALDRMEFLAAEPLHPHAWTVVSASLRWAQLAVRVLLLAVLALVIGTVVDHVSASRKTPGNRSARVGRALAIVGVTAIAIFGAALRLDAITGSYGVVTSPAWLAAIQTSAHGPLRALQPAGIAWPAVPLYPHPNGPDTHYRSDPYTYLEYARTMRHFSDAHHREPVFPFATRMWLRALSDQDIAVSFTSASFAVLAIVFTYLLGSLAFSRPVGLAAAAAFAIEYTAIAWNIAGWRDDAFTFATVAFAFTVLRTARRPTYGNAALAGAAAAGAILIRITALSFVLPGLLWLCLAPTSRWRHRLGLTTAAASLAVVLVAPYVINCWRVYGDPLHAINAVTPNLPDSRSTESRDGAFHYLVTKMTARPFEMLDVTIRGLTEHPFTNKWEGFQPWAPGWTPWIAAACLAGLMLFTTSAAGRFLLLILVSATVPFSLTWQLASDWRYTEHAYPFFLIAAAAAIAAVVHAARPSTIRGWRERAHGLVRPFAIWSATTAVVAAAVVAIAWGIPVLIAREALAADGRAAFVTGARDRAFYRSGWSEPVTTGNVTKRYAVAGAVVSIPLPDAHAYAATIRLDPFPRPFPEGPDRLPLVRASLNGPPIDVLDLQWNPERVGSYDVVFPAHLVRAGFNDLRLDVVPRGSALDGATAMPRPGLTDGAAFGVWYVQVQRVDTTR
jgi:hypothetical protein